MRTVNEFDDCYQQLQDDFNEYVDNFQELGSGFVFHRILRAELQIAKTKEMRASSYIKTEFTSHSITNVQNKDQKCFLWSILAKLYPTNDHKHRVTNYVPYENRINMKNIEYPVKIKDIDKVEKQNSNLSINVFGLQNPKDKKSIFPMRISTSSAENNIDLLYLSNETNTHYILIKDLKSFCCNEKSYHSTFLCRRCLTTFSKQEALSKHSILCQNHGLAKAIMPQKSTVKFKKHHFMFRLPFVFYADFESTNTPIQTCEPDPNKSYFTQKCKQEVISYGLYVKSDYDKIFRSRYLTFTGTDAVQHFVETVVWYFEEISKNWNVNKKVKIKPREEEDFQNATECFICKNEFANHEEKIREHSHYDGKYRGAA